jgi:uncharacterized protein
MKKILTTLFVGFLCFGIVQAQFKIPPKPELQTSVYDYTELLSTSEAKFLEDKLIRYADSTSTQIVVVTIESAQGEYINYLATEWGEQWGIGQKGKDNGILILIVEETRKVAIATGKGIEATLTDFQCSRVIEEYIRPEFRKGNYLEGLDAATDRIIEILGGEFAQKKKHEEFVIGIPGIILLIVSVIVLFFLALFMTRAGWYDFYGASLHGSRTYGSKGTSLGGGSVGGGFSGGFGGGSFGGGGASGSW